MTEKSAEKVAAGLAAAPAGPQGKGKSWWAAMRTFLIIMGVIFGANYLAALWAEHHVRQVAGEMPFKMVGAKELPTLWGPAPSEKENAGPLYAEIRRRLDALLVTPEGGDKRSSEQAKRSDEFDRLLVMWGLCEPDDWPDENADGENQKAKIPPRDAVRVHKFLDQFAEVFKLRDEALRRPGCREDLDWSDCFKACSGNWMLPKLTVLQSAVAAGEGRWDEAYAEICDVGAMARHFEQEPASICMGLIVGSIRQEALGQLSRLLQEHPPTKAQAEELRRLFAVDGGKQLRNCLAGESVAGLEMFQQQCGKVTANGWPRLVSGSGQVWWFYNEATYLKNMGRMYSVAKEPCGRAVAEFSEIEKKTQERHFLTMFADMSAKIVADLAKHFYAGEAEGRMVDVALQLAAYRQEHGRYPAGLGELPQAGKLPGDPFTETGGAEGAQPFHYRLVGEGFVLWSVGPEGKDGEKTTVEELEDSKGRHVFLALPPREKR